VIDPKPPLGLRRLWKVVDAAGWPSKTEHTEGSAGQAFAIKIGQHPGITHRWRAVAVYAEKSGEWAVDCMWIIVDNGPWFRVPGVGDLKVFLAEAPRWDRADLDLWRLTIEAYAENAKIKQKKAAAGRSKTRKDGLS